MTTKKSLGSQVKRLLSDVSEHGNQHLTEAETDLQQTTFLLGEAIEKLTTSFMAIHEAVAAQQETVSLLLAGATLPIEKRERLEALHATIGQQVNAAVTGLQFQDMTTQLIERTVRRVTSLREVLDLLGGTGSDILAESAPEDIAEMLHELNAVIEGQAQKLESVLWKPVQQTHMESGDVELF